MQKVKLHKTVSAYSTFQYMQKEETYTQILRSTPYDGRHLNQGVIAPGNH